MNIVLVLSIIRQEVRRKTVYNTNKIAWGTGSVKEEERREGSGQGKGADTGYLPENVEGKRMMYRLAIPMTFLGAMGAYFFKKASVQVTNIRTLLRSKELYLGGLLYVISAVMNILLLRYLQYSILYPMTAITYIWTVIVSHNLLGEKISKKMILGITLICVSVIILTN